MKYDAILFDLDGTLVDSLADLTDAMNCALARLGLPPHTPGACRRMIGYGTLEFVRRALPPGRQNRAETLRTSLLQFYDDRCLHKSRPYPGIPQLLPALKQKGLRLAVISNKNHPQTAKIVTHFFGREIFDFICGMTDGRRPKPDPDMAAAALSAVSADPARTLLVGDSDIDIQTAHAAGIDAAAAEWGYRDLQTLKAANPKYLISNPDQILDLIT